jgi:hypothetical protein
MKPKLRKYKLRILGIVLLGGSALYNQSQSQTPLPNITINAARIQQSLVFDSSMFKAKDCAVVEGCVGGTGKRRLLRFAVQTPNIGNADLYLGNPVNNPAFEFSPCHGHYHLNGYASYDLLQLDRTPVVVSGRNIVGHKQAFCLLDSVKIDPAAGPAKYNCSNQGISVGWSDVYGASLDCQWVDVTGVPVGQYLLRVTINGGPDGPHQFLESNYNDNVATVTVNIPRHF